MICAKYGCNFELDMDGQVTCVECGAMDDDKQSINLDNL
jgi:hypothetical protein